MSHITENTIVILSSHKKEFLEDCGRFSEEHMMSLKEVYDNGRFAVYVTDCNGDLPWTIFPNRCKCNPVALETMHGKNDRITIFDGKSQKFRLIAILKRYRILGDDLEKVKQLIAYSF